MSILQKAAVVKATWSAPANICAYTTTKHLGNFALDQNPALLLNRQKLKNKLNLPQEPSWLKQIHGNKIIELGDISSALPTGDGSYTQNPHQICSILTADCLPIAICSANGHEIAALHAGWRSLLGDIIKNGIQSFKSKPHELIVWLGPAISAQFFIVNDDLYNQFVKKDKCMQKAFTKLTPKHFHCCLYELAKQHLIMAGVQHIFQDNYCTYKDKTLFYSYRRQNQHAGRMATLIWRND